MMLRIALLMIVAIAAAHKSRPLVKTVYGTVRGLYNEEGGYSSFTGMHYAQAPTGRDRFKSALPPPSWKGIFEATRNDIACLQVDNDSIVGTEDCLTLNVYTPNVASPKNPIAVMVFFHGGAFINGSVRVYTEEFLITRGVVVVLVNYRLSGLGYLCLKHELIPGNAGFKDQVAALRWVQQNIAAFGGDPDNVTLMGQSAGGVSIELHSLSPMAEGLFKKVIPISGTALAFWAVNPDPIQYATTMAQVYLGYDGDSLDDLVEFYLNIDNESLVWATVQYYLDLSHKSFPVAGCVEKIQPGVEAFLIDSVANILESGKYKSVPIIYTVTNREYINLLLTAEVEELVQTLETGLPTDLVFQSNQQRTEIADRVRNFYINNETSILESYVNYKSDSMFFDPMARVVKKRRLKSTAPIYVLEFTYESERRFPRLPEAKGITGAGHQDDLLFLIALSDLPISVEDQLTIDRYTTLFSNFAKYGNPTPRNVPVGWRRVTKKKLRYLELGTQLTLSHSPNAAAIAFWEEIYAAAS